MTVIIFILVLAVLIFVHELGHFLLAKINGIRVDAFALGFGPRILSWQGKETRYSVNLIPFGGYVKIFGETPDEESIDGPESHRSFVHKNRLRQISVLVAGVFFNFLFAWLLYVIIFTSGVTATTDGFEAYADSFSNPRIMITDVLPNSPAEKAGLVVGDSIREIGGLKESSPDFKVEAIQKIIDDSQGKPLQITVVRGQHELDTLTLTAEQGLVPDKYAVGIAMQNVADLQLPFGTAIYEGAHYTLVMIRETALGLYTFIANIFRGQANFSDVTGPIGIAGIVGNAASMGFTYLLMVTALISINLGVINLVPFPALDGGRVLFVLIEAVVRRPISPRIANTINGVGFVALMVLMVVVTYKDIVKLWHP